MANAVQTFGMTDQQISAAEYMRRDFFDQCLLGFAIEIDHDVPTKNHVELGGKGIARLQQIQWRKLDSPPQLFLYAILSFGCANAALKITALKLGRHLR